MKFKSSLSIAIILTISTFASAQKADPVKPATVKFPAVSEILSQYVKAIGGRDAHGKFKTRMTSGTVEIMPMGIKGTFETYAAADSKSLVKMNLSGIGEMVDAYDGKTAWAMNPIQGSREKSGAEVLQAQLANNFYRDINLEKLYAKMAVTGIEKVGGKDAYVVTAASEGLPLETFYFDVATGLLLRSDATILSPEGNQPAKVFFEEMRSVDGILVPVKIRTSLAQMEIIMTTSDVKNGVVIDDAKFAKPKQ